MKDLANDLQTWETLVASSMMQKPFITLIDGEPNDSKAETNTSINISDHQQENLRSAIAYACLNLPESEVEELDLYR